jgi:hypothetical protein
MHVNMVLAHDTAQYPNILCIADLDQQLSTALLDISRQHLISIFGHPNEVNRQPRNRVTTVSIIAHGHSFCSLLHIATQKAKDE